MIGAIGSLVARVRGNGGHGRMQRDAVTAFVVRIASAALIYLSQIVLARWMGAFEYGIFVVVWTWVLMIGGLATLGLSTLMIRLLPEYRETGQLELLRGLLLGARLLGVASSTVVALTGFAALRLFGNLLDDHYVLPAHLALVCIPFVTLTDLQDAIGRANGWIGLALLPPYVLRPLIVLIALMVAHEAGLDMSAATATGTAIIAACLTALVQAVLVDRRLRAVLPAGRRRFEPSGWLAASLPLLAIAGCELLLQNVDVLVLSHYRPPAEVAIYFAAAKTMSIVLFVHYAVGSAAAGRLSALNARGDKAGLQAAVAAAVNWTFWPSLTLACLILALGRPVLALFGPSFADGHYLMFALAMGFLARAAMGPSEFILNMLGEQRLCAAVLGLTALINLALSVALVPSLGLAGAALSNAIAMTVGALSSMIAVRLRLDLDIPIWKNLPKLARQPS